MKRFVLRFVPLLILCSLIVSLPKINIAKASGTIYIRADGSVEPANAPIQRVGTIYTFTGYIDRIVVQRSNIIIDGNGNTLLSTGGASAVYLMSVRNVTIKNMIIKNCMIGIHLEDSSYVTISGNTITETEMAFFYPSGGIMIHGGGSNIIVGNNITNNRLGIYFGQSSNNRIYHNNFINNENQIYDLSWHAPHNLPSVNIWFDYPSGGNYWDNYTGVDNDDDGIGDTPYVIDENNRDPYPLMNPWGPPRIHVVSPDFGKYAVTDVPLTFTVDKSTSWIGYSLDEQANRTISGNTTLTGLSDGSHNLTVYATDIFGNTGSSVRIYFTIDTPPSISILSPQNKTHNTTDIPLTFTVNETASWIGYSLDGQANNTIAGNTTLTELSDGMHSLIVYAKDSAGNTGTSETIYFSIAQQSEPFPTTWIVAAVIIIAVVGVAPLVYFRKIKKTTGSGWYLLVWVILSFLALLSGVISGNMVTIVFGAVLAFGFTLAYLTSYVKSEHGLKKALEVIFMLLTFGVIVYGYIVTRSLMFIVALIFFAFGLLPRIFEIWRRISKTF